MVAGQPEKLESQWHNHSKHEFPHWLLTERTGSEFGLRYVGFCAPGSGSALSRDDMKILSSQQEKWCLDISTVIVTKEGMELLAKSSTCTGVTFDNVNVDDVFFEALEDSESVTSVILRRLLVTDSSIISMSKMKKLKKIYIQACPLLTRSAVYQLARQRRDVEIVIEDSILNEKRDAE